jgi:hypothetical protein
MDRQPCGTPPVGGIGELERLLAVDIDIGVETGVKLWIRSR